LRGYALSGPLSRSLLLRPGDSSWWIPTRSATPSTALVPQRKVGFLIPNAGLLLGFQGTKTARRGGISSPFSDAGGCTSPQNSGVSKTQPWAREVPSLSLPQSPIRERSPIVRRRLRFHNQ